MNVDSTAYVAIVGLLSEPISQIRLGWRSMVHKLVAERLSMRRLIPLHCQIAFVCMYVCIYLCPAAHAGIVQYGSLLH